MSRLPKFLTAWAGALGLAFGVILTVAPISTAAPDPGLDVATGEIGLTGASFAGAAADAGTGTNGLAGGIEHLLSCSGDVCLRIGDPDPAELAYGGIRPFFTDWSGTQDYAVVVNGGGDGDGDPLVAGTYPIEFRDVWTPFLTYSQYQYGDFEPTQAAGDPDLGWFGDMSGAHIYTGSLFGGALKVLTMDGVGPHDLSYIVISSGDFTNSMVYDYHGTNADFIQTGDAPAQFLWNTGWHPDLAHNEVPDYLIPPDWFTGMDFDPSEYLE